jgi:hypothetical protein
MPSYDAQGFDPPAPVATITLRTPGGRRSLDDIAMLIDSGADLSLLPERSVRRLGLVVEVREDCELAGFDGNKSVARFVQCELIFLGRGYRGGFLVLDDAIGILGRDVLNHVSIVLDEPQRNWREEHAVE